MPSASRLPVTFAGVETASAIASDGARHGSPSRVIVTSRTDATACQPVVTRSDVSVRPRSGLCVTRRGCPEAAHLARSATFGPRTQRPVRSHSRADQSAIDAQLSSMARRAALDPRSQPACGPPPARQQADCAAAGGLLIGGDQMTRRTCRE